MGFGGRFWRHPKQLLTIVCIILGVLILLIDNNVRNGSDTRTEDIEEHWGRVDEHVNTYLLAENWTTRLVLKYPNTLAPEISRIPQVHSVVPTAPHWRPLTGDIFFYSVNYAFPQSEFVRNLVFVGMSRLDHFAWLHKSHWTCVAINNASVDISTTRGSFLMIPEQAESKYIAIQVRCPAPYHHTLVSLIRLENRHLNRSLLFPHPFSMTRLPKRYSMAHCGSPLFLDYYSARDVVEFVEYYKLHGINHFFVYNLGQTGEVKKTLRHYQRASMMTILDWTLPVPTKEFNNVGQLASINDCFLRASASYEFVLNIDMDEFVAFERPSGFGTLPVSQHDCFVFLNSFILEPKRRRAKDAWRGQSRIGDDNLMRQDLIYPFDNRSKYFCRGYVGIEPAIHRPHLLLNDSSFLVVPPTEAILLHSRTIVQDSTPKWIPETRLLHLVKTLRENLAHTRTLIESFVQS